MKLRPGLGVFYAIQPGDGSVLFSSSWNAHGAILELSLQSRSLRYTKPLTKLFDATNTLLRT